MVGHRKCVLHEHLKRAGSSQLPGSPAEPSQVECTCWGGALGGMTASRVSALQLYLRRDLRWPQRNNQALPADDCLGMEIAAEQERWIVHV